MKFIYLTAALCLLALPVHAADAKKIGTYGAWTAYSYAENGGTVCYMAASPTSSDRRIHQARRRLRHGHPPSG